MALVVTTRNLPNSWKRSLAGRVTRSIHFQIAILFNGICFLKLIEVIRSHLWLFKARPELVSLFAIVVLALLIASCFMWRIYQIAKAELTVQETSALSVLSYVAFRIYLLVLGVAFLLLQTINILPF